MTSSIEIRPVTLPLDASIRPPGSKSLTNRALVCAALAEGTSNLRGALDSEDTRVMIEALRTLGISIVEHHDRQTLRVTGCGGKIPATSADLYVANSGTTVRFLTALVSLGHGTYRLHGTPRMHERPIQDLLDALKRLGVRAESESGTGCPPVVVRADGLRLDKVSIRGDVSSQFLSALLLAAPCAEGPLDDSTVDIEIVGKLVSKPYVGDDAGGDAGVQADVASATDLDGLRSRACAAIGLPTTRSSPTPRPPVTFGRRPRLPAGKFASNGLERA